jgi:multidrug efflux pump subunit AcrA (membrane-fusion protein)
MSRRVGFACLTALTLLAGGAPATAAEFVVAPVAIPDMKAVFGRVETTRVVPARARIGGSIRAIEVSEGDEVREGKVLAVVVDDKLALELNAAAAKIEALNAQLANARLELERAQQLMARGATTQARLDQAQTQFDVVVSQVAAAQAERTVIEQRAREGEVLAPADGRVLTVPVTLGSVVLAGEEIARVASGRYYLRLSLPERHAAGIRQGAAVRIGERGLSPAAGGGIAAARPGRVVKVYPEIAGGRVVADVEVDGIGGYLVGERTLVWIPGGGALGHRRPAAGGGDAPRRRLCARGRRRRRARGRGDPR